MRGKITDLRRRLYLVGAVVLLAGLCGAGVLYRTAGDDSDRVAGYEMAGGNVYPVAPENSKTYRHDLEVFGGRSAVLSDAIGRWFAGLWHGKSLALTVACVTVLISVGIFFVGARLPYLRTRDVPDGGGRGESGRGR
jgi:hypothetical protein